MLQVLFIFFLWSIILWFWRGIFSFLHDFINNIVQWNVVGFNNSSSSSSSRRRPWQWTNALIQHLLAHPDSVPKLLDHFRVLQDFLCPGIPRDWNRVISTRIVLEEFELCLQQYVAYLFTPDVHHSVPDLVCSLVHILFCLWVYSERVPLGTSCQCRKR